MVLIKWIILLLQTPISKKAGFFYYIKVKYLVLALCLVFIESDFFCKLVHFQLMEELDGRLWRQITTTFSKLYQKWTIPRLLRSITCTPSAFINKEAFRKMADIIATLRECFPTLALHPIPFSTLFLTSLLLTKRISAGRRWFPSKPNRPTFRTSYLSSISSRVTCTKKVDIFVICFFVAYCLCNVKRC